MISFIFDTYRERNLFIKFLNNLSKNIDININKKIIEVDFKNNDILLSLAQKYYLEME